MPFGNDKIGQLQFARTRGRANYNVAEQGPKRHIAAMLRGEFFDNFGPTFGVGAIILGDNLDRAAIDAAGVVDQLGRGCGRAVIPPAIGCADTGSVHLKTDLDWL